MNALTRRGPAVALLATALLIVHVPSALAQNPMPGMADMPGMTMNLPPVKIPAGADYTEADVRFMQGMIGHHGQAVYMTSLAKAHGASDRLLTLAQKISQSQIAEIGLMQGWLRANGQFAPDSSAWRHMMMPGMLTADQLAQLDAAHGQEFDRLFLTFMIQHHEGALQMVHALCATPLAGQDIDGSVFANDVHTVQTAEIGIIQLMLSTL
jgi:uncharacterized protein (DUF305 family)